MVSMAVELFAVNLFFSWLKTGSGNRIFNSDAANVSFALGLLDCSKSFFQFIF